MRPFLIAVACAVVLLVSGAPAAIAGGHQPQTDPITGMFTFTTVQIKQRTCVGQDATQLHPYLDITVSQVGTAAGDARISGELSLTSHILLNTATGLGTSEGDFVVRDATTGRKKAAGQFHGVIAAVTPAPTFALEGLLTGKVFDEGVGTEDQVGSGRVVANLEAFFDAALNGTGSFGGVGSGLNSAVIESGHCSGPVTRIP